jgi:hypothetical protein
VVAGTDAPVGKHRIQVALRQSNDKCAVILTATNACWPTGQLVSVVPGSEQIDEVPFALGITCMLEAPNNCIRSNVGQLHRGCFAFVSNVLGPMTIVLPFSW